MNQDNSNKNKFTVQFEAKILSIRQRTYSQIKKKLWGIVSTIKTEKNYLIRTVVVIKTDCSPLLGIIINCSTPDIAILK
ncbi:hypothetical protein GCM10010495_82240 [Kitasatospora herbaricolor]|nr:hypothetical protein GCM10010495_82240 [Kitasatospora herbaricolor]